MSGAGKVMIILGRVCRLRELPASRNGQTPRAEELLENQKMSRSSDQVTNSL